MQTARCLICRQKRPSLKALMVHYLKHHSKIHLIQRLLKCQIQQTIPKLSAKHHTKLPKNKRPSCLHIQCGDKKIVLVENESVELEITLMDKHVVKKCRKIKNGKKYKHYTINISKSDMDRTTLNEKTGDFYYCQCRRDSTPSGASDSTESAPDISAEQFFCDLCGFIFENQMLLAQHIKVHHDTYCNICSTRFSCVEHLMFHIKSHMNKIYVCHLCNLEFRVLSALRQHFNMHVEDDQILDTILDMERDYNIVAPQMSFAQCNYRSNINGIVGFLAEHAPL